MMMMMIINNNDDFDDDHYDNNGVNEDDGEYDNRVFFWIIKELRWVAWQWGVAVGHGILPVSVAEF